MVALLLLKFYIIGDFVLMFFFIVVAVAVAEFYDVVFRLMFILLL